jgi:hypothetical protein
MTAGLGFELRGLVSVGSSSRVWCNQLMEYVCVCVVTAIGIAFIAGMVLFSYLLFPLTDPSMYHSWHWQLLQAAEK